MPTYDYRCESCGITFEHFQAISSPLLRKCTKCGKLALKRLIGAGAGFLFKGSGFYITDYRSPSYQEAVKKDAAPASGSVAGPGEKKPDKPGKPDAATPPAAPSTPAPMKKSAERPSKRGKPR